jgi:hypothetical protein
MFLMKYNTRSRLNARIGPPKDIAQKPEDYENDPAGGNCVKKITFFRLSGRFPKLATAKLGNVFLAARSLG